MVSKSFHVRQNFCISTSPIWASERMWLVKVQRYCGKVANMIDTARAQHSLDGDILPFHFFILQLSLRVPLLQPPSYWGASTLRVWLSSLTSPARWDARTMSSSWTLNHGGKGNYQRWRRFFVQQFEEPVEVGGLPKKAFLPQLPASWPAEAEEIKFELKQCSERLFCTKINQQGEPWFRTLETLRIK